MHVRKKVTHELSWKNNSRGSTVPGHVCVSNDVRSA